MLVYTTVNHCALFFYITGGQRPKKPQLFLEEGEGLQRHLRGLERQNG